jgi:hypothetical protein
LKRSITQQARETAGNFEPSRPTSIRFRIWWNDRAHINVKSSLSTVSTSKRQKGFELRGALLVASVRARGDNERDTLGSIHMATIWIDAKARDTCGPAVGASRVSPSALQSRPMAPATVLAAAAALSARGPCRRDVPDRDHLPRLASNVTQDHRMVMSTEAAERCELDEASGLQAATINDQNPMAVIRRCSHTALILAVRCSSTTFRRSTNRLGFLSGRHADVVAL